MFDSLLHSRKFWIAVFGVFQAVILHYVDMPPELWQAIAGLCAVLIAGIAAEDAASKSRMGAAIELGYAKPAGDADNDAAIQ